MITSVLDRIAGRAPISLIIRHAERNPIVRMEAAFDALLTEKGKEDARDLGKRLSALGPIRLYSSPIERCVQTAEYIKRGITEGDGTGVFEGSLPDLGGPYITGLWEDVVRKVEELGQPVFVRKWFDGELPESLVMPLEQAARNQVSILRRQLGDGAHSSVNVTHDWNIMILREYFFNLRHDDIAAPPYLDGIAAYMEKGALRLLYHDRECAVSSPG